jgi:uncharacterized phage protein gp47/JayE
MAFPRPTLPELIDQGAADFEGRLPGVLATVRRSLIGVINRVFAGGLSALYQFAEYHFKQAWPDTCDVEYLEDHGARKNIYRIPAASATGMLSVVGSVSMQMPAGTLFQRTDGVQFSTTLDVVGTGVAYLVPVQAVDAGQSGNTVTGAALSLVAPVAGFASAATVASELSGGADAEMNEAFRARIVARWRTPSSGGNLQDYIDWAEEVAGVTRAWVYPGEQGAGSVVVRFVRDADVTPIPDAGEVATVQAHIDAVRPVTARAIVVAPIAVPLNLTIQLTPNTPAVQAAVTEDLADMLVREGSPGCTLPVSHLRQVISDAVGETDSILITPASNVVYATGQMPVLGVITWA